MHMEYNVLYSRDFQQMINRYSGTDDWIIRALNTVHVIINLHTASSLQSVFASVVIYRDFFMGPLLCVSSTRIIRTDPALFLMLWNGCQNMVPTVIAMKNHFM